jgi:hypothetical protein
MAFALIKFKNPNTGSEEIVPIGVSWTILFWGFLVPLFRGDWKLVMVMLPLGLITLNLSNIKFMFNYNEIYIKKLISSGFKAEYITTGFTAKNKTSDDLDFASKKLGMEIPMLNKKKSAEAEVLVGL